MPVAGLEALAQSSAPRRAFTLDEIRKLLAVAEPDWRTMILLGLYSGQRLQDCARLTWREVDLLQGCISLETEKTGRRQVIPVAEPLARHLVTRA